MKQITLNSDDFYSATELLHEAKNRLAFFATMALAWDIENIPLTQNDMAGFSDLIDSVHGMLEKGDGLLTQK